jgi:hypothetical protein
MAVNSAISVVLSDILYKKPAAYIFFSIAFIDIARSFSKMADMFPTHLPIRHIRHAFHKNH